MDEHNNESIPDLHKYPAIIKAARDGKLIVFVGAGASILKGYSSWKNYADRKVEYLKNNNLINYYVYEKLRGFDPKKALSLCEIILLENKEFVDDSKFLEPVDKKKECRIYDDLYAFNAVYVTTNYDDCLDKVAEDTVIEQVNGSAPNQPVQNVVKKKKVFYLEDEMLISKLLEPGNVLHIHGSIKDQSSRVVTVQDYIKRYGREARLETLLEEIFSKYTVLFVGYGLEEYEILDFIINTSQRCKRKHTEHYALYSMFSPEKELYELHRKYYRALNIELIPYLLDQNGYEGLVKVISEWSQIIAPIARRPYFVESKKMIDEVL